MFELLIPPLVIFVLLFGVGPLSGDLSLDDGISATEAVPVGEPVPVAPARAARPPDPQTPTGLYTTATEVKPILGMTRASWVAVQDNDGTDFLYFTNILAWRCGIWEVRYGLNGAAPAIALPLEPCHDDTAAPNAITDPVTWPIYITAPGGTIESVEVEILFDDGTVDSAVFARQSVLMPG